MRGNTEGRCSINYILYMLNKKEREIVIGTILGDGYLQMTGARNARLRLEHGVKQKNYIFWKWQQLQRIMQSPPKKIIRYNPIYKATYGYYRCQSHSSPELGKLRQLFYRENQKVVPDNLDKIFRSNLSLAVWYMDDGYYYHRDKTAYIYLSNLSKENLDKLMEVLKKNFNLIPKIEIKKRGNFNFKFTVAETDKLINLIQADVIPSMKYKLPKSLNIPVST